jgi:capsular polysaccharide biosynthesis protein
MPEHPADGPETELQRYAAVETKPGPGAMNGRPSGAPAVYSGRSRVVPAPRSEGIPIYFGRAPEEVIRPAARRSLLSILVRRWQLIALVTVACVVGSMTYVLLAPPHYRSSAQILVTPAAPEANLEGLRLIGGSEPTRVVQTAVALLDTPAVAVRTAEKLGNPYTATSVENAVTVEPRGQSYIVSVSAEAGTARAAALLADTFARSALDLRNEDVKAQAARLARSITTSMAAAHASADSDPGVAQLARLRLLATTGDPTVSLAAAAPTPTARAGIPAPFVVLLALVFGLILAAATAMAWDAVRSPHITDAQWE